MLQPDAQTQRVESMSLSMSQPHDDKTQQVVQQPRKFKTFDFPEGFVLPKTIYYVTGLESSGTNLVSDIIAKALQVKYKRGKGLLKKGKEKKDIWVHHLSLPAGRDCERVPVPYNLTTLLPGFCYGGRGGSFDPQNADLCRVLGKDAKVPMFEDGTQFTKNRIFTDIIGTKEWWESLGVEFKVIIILRDTSMARIGRRKHKYCLNETLLLNEEEFGKDIIRRAIEKYIMPEEDDDADTRIRRRLSSTSHSETATLPMGNGVVLLSFESLVQLKDTYVKMIYKALDIESNYMPLICDANARYVEGYNKTAQEFSRGANKIIKSC